MTRTTFHLSVAAFALAAAACFAVAPAAAQGTQEQQDACAPDAFKLCQNTIPDIPKTEACMRAHYAQLSPRCQHAFNDATGGDSSKPPSDVARGEDRAPPPPPVVIAPRDDEPAVAVVPYDSPMRSYAAQIRGYCREGLIDPFTCRNTLSLLRESE